MNETASREQARAKRTEKAVSAPPGSEISASSGVYGRFWELPGALVLAVLWTAGVVLIGLCAFALYLVVAALA
jgi:hypothetical protein